MQTPYEEAAGASLFGDILRKPLSGGQVQKGKVKKRALEELKHANIRNNMQTKTCDVTWEKEIPKEGPR